MGHGPGLQRPSHQKLHHGSKATESNTVSVGAGTNNRNYPATRRIVNVANGTAANDAVNKAQLDTGLSKKVNGGTYTAGNNNLAIGNSTVNGNHTIAIGNNGYTRAQAEQAIAIGNTAHADGGYSVALGVGAKTAANTNYGVAIGNAANAGGNFSVALGSFANANDTYSQAFGYNAQALGAYSMALGSQTSIAASVTNAVALGYGSQATENNTVSVGSSTIKRRITNVNNGTNANDAATVGQVNSIVTVDKDPTTQAASGTVSLKDAAGTTTKATVYTSAEVDKKIKAQDTAALKTRLDTVQQVVKNDTANATVIRGGTGTTALLLTDQDKAGTNTQSGANFGSTIYTDTNGTEAAPAAFTDADYITLGGTAATDPNTNTVSSSQAVDGLVYYTASNKPIGALADQKQLATLS